MVDLPDPDRPTIAVQEFPAMLMDTFFRTSVRGRDGYRKLALVSLIGVKVDTFNWP